MSELHVGSCTWPIHSTNPGMKSVPVDGMDQSEGARIYLFGGGKVGQVPRLISADITETSLRCHNPISYISTFCCSQSSGGKSMKELVGCWPISACFRALFLFYSQPAC
jgi:hypothetical protein